MGTGNRIEMMIAVCALVSSMMAVYIAWDQGRVMRAQQHGEVFPVIQIDGFATNNTERSALGLRVSNSGVGPALIESVVLEVEGEPVESLDQQLATLPDGYDLSWASLTGRALAPGAQTTPVEIAWRRNDIEPEEIASFAANSTANWRLRICYCSVFNRCWRTNSLGTARADRVATCEQHETDIFADLGNRPPPTWNGPASATDLTSADGAPQ